MGIIEDEMIIPIKKRKIVIGIENRISLNTFLNKIKGKLNK